MQSVKRSTLVMALVAVFFLTGSALAADLTDWQLRNSRLNAMASGNGIFVAVGKNGFAMRSPDGISWSAVASGVEDDLGGVAFGNDLFVAVGSGNIIVSSDGSTWSEVTPPSGFYGNSIAFGNGTFVALNGSDSVFTSTAGTSWTKVTLAGVPGTLTHISFGGGLFIAVGYSGAIVTSADFSAGYNVPAPVTTHTIRQAAYGNSTYVAVGESGLVLTSGNGIAWTTQSSGLSDTFMAVGYGNNGFVITGSSSSSTAGRIWTSPTALGPSWTSQPSPAFEWYFDAHYVDNTYFLIGGKIISSTNGVDWNIVHGATGWDIWSVAYGNGVYTAGTMTGDIVISDNGITWTKPEYPDVTTISGMAYCPANQRFVAAVSDGSLLYSDDNGATWVAHSFTAPVGLNGLYWVHDRFIGLGANGTIIFSPDGGAWSSAVVAPSSKGLQAAVFGDNTYVLVGNNGAVVTSQNSGTSWQEQPAVTTENLNGVAYGNGMFLAAGGYNREVITSSNGTNWALATNHPMSVCYDVVFFDDTFILMGSSGGVYASADGTQWDLIQVPTSDTLFAGTTAGSGILVAGMSGSIVQLIAPSPPGGGGSGGGGSGGGCFLQVLDR
jgi:hypothetical protein